jgi:hypothetical protein
MFKLFVKLMLFLLVLALAGPFVLKGPDGVPLLSLSDLKLPDVSSVLPAKDVALESASEPGGQQWIQWSGRDAAPFNPDKLTREQLAQLDIREQANIYYRWQDQNGVWQFSSLPNRNTLNHVVRTDPDANVLQSLSQEQIDKVFGRVAPNENSITRDNPLANGKGLENSLPIPTTIPVTEIPKLLEQAKDVQKIAETRLKQMDSIGQ